jgi:chromosome segregation ATPase
MLKNRMTAMIATLAVSASLFTGTAFAQTNGTATPPPAASEQSSDWLADLKAKLETLMQLRIEAAKLQVQIKEQTVINRDLFRKLESGTGKETAQQIKERIQQRKLELEKTVQPLRERMKRLEQQLKEANQRKEKEKAIALRAEMADLRQQLKAALEGAKGQPEELKQLEEQLKARREALKSIREQVKELEQEQRELWEKVKSLHETQKANWKAFETALKQVDHNGMLAALDKVMETRQEINATLQQILDLKVKIGDLLKQALEGQTGSN